MRHQLHRWAITAAVACVCALAAPGTAGAAEPTVTLGAAGNIACGPLQAPSTSECQQDATASLMTSLDPDAVATLGDQQYDSATASEYSQFYANSWGTMTVPVHPVPGNHEYMDPAGNAAGYFGYFGPAAGNPSRGYYSYDLGSWHIIALNSACNVTHNCAPGSAQERWLRADLAAHPRVCTLAYWHHPLFTTGETRGDPNNAATRSFWHALYRHGADIVLNAHDHSYQRFAPQTPNGASDPAQGIREFIVGTGGRSLFTGTVPAANLQVRDISNFGVLLLTLDSGHYSWRFYPTQSGGFTDSGSGRCHETTPVLRLRAHWLRIAVKTGMGAARAKCDSAAGDRCVVRVTLFVRGRKVGTGRATIPAGKLGMLRVRLNRNGRLMLSRSRTHKLRVRAVGAPKNHAGVAGPIDRTLMLKGMARRRR
ncbi:MAG TPA: metallophosphoesterase [Thermoleophilaceae bacterium]